MRDQFGQRLLDFHAEQMGVVLQVGKEARAVRAQRVQHLKRLVGPQRIVDRGGAELLPVRQRVALAKQHRRAADRSGPAPGFVARSGRPPPDHAAGCAELVEHVGRVVAHASREQVFFP